MSLSSRTVKIMECEFNNTVPSACTASAISEYGGYRDNECTYKWFFNRTTESSFYLHARALAKMDVMLHCNVALDQDHGCVFVCDGYYEEGGVFRLKTCETDWLYGVRSLSEKNKDRSLQDELYKGVPFSAVTQYVDAAHKKCCYFDHYKFCPFSHSCADSKDSPCDVRPIIEMQIVGQYDRYDYNGYNNDRLDQCKIIAPALYYA